MTPKNPPKFPATEAGVIAYVREAGRWVGVAEIRSEVWRGKSDFVAKGSLWPLLKSAIAAGKLACRGGWDARFEVSIPEVKP